MATQQFYFALSNVVQLLYCNCAQTVTLEKLLENDRDREHCDSDAVILQKSKRTSK